MNVLYWMVQCDALIKRSQCVRRVRVGPEKCGPYLCRACESRAYEGWAIPAIEKHLAEVFGNE